MKNANSMAISLIGAIYSIEGIKVTIKERIDESQYGTIFICYDLANAKHVIKVLQTYDEESRQRILNEFIIQKSISGFPNVVKIEGIQEIENSIKILTEYCELSLFNEYSRFLAIGFSTEKIVDIFYSVLSVIKVMHEQIVPISYRDIRIENVVCKNGVWKLCNFSSSTTTQYLQFPDEESRQKAQRDIQRNISPCNRSPEMVDLYSGYPINEKTDIWTLGCFLFKLCNFKDAFPGGSVNAIKSATYQWHPSWKIDDYLKCIIEKCLQIDPRKRPTIQQLAQEFRAHFGIKETSFATKFRKSPKIKYGDYIEEVLNFQPPPSNEISDESDIEMDDESKLVQDTAFEKVKIDSNAFDQLFDFTDESTSESQSKTEIIDLSEASHIDLEFRARAPSMIRDEESSSTEEEEEGEGEGIDENDDNFLLFKSPKSLMKKIYNSDDEKILSIIENIKENPEFGEFILSYVQLSGSKGTNFLILLPENMEYSKSSKLNEYIHLRKEFATKFSMFEGNLSLHDFTQANLSSPPPPGNPPVSVEVIQNLLNLIEKLIDVLSDQPFQLFADEGRYLYRCACYITAKLRQFSIEIEMVNSTILSKMDELHSQILKILQSSELQSSFPLEPFNFRSYKALLKLRAPKHINIFE